MKPAAASSLRLVALLSGLLAALVTGCHAAPQADPADTGDGDEPPAGSGAGPDATAAPTAGEGWTFAPAATCPAPVAGFDRLTERGAALGLATPLHTAADEGSCGVTPGALVAADLDGDGADELIVNHVDAAPVLVRA